MTDELVAAWVGTMAGSEGPGGFTVAHRGGLSAVGTRLVDRAEREQLEASLLAPGATRATGAGNRARPEEPDDLRTCFERDRDRIVHSRAFRRLAGKTQVFVYPADHQRTRLTHALEVAQVAAAVARATSLNVALTEAIALGHDCGHGPGGHASEGVFADALGSFHHASFGADITLAPLNLCRETLDGIRCHSWSQPAPATPEGAVVSWADRIAYCAHDLEDAERAGIVSAEELPAVVRDAAGSRRSGQLRFFIDALIAGIEKSGVVAMGRGPAEVLGALREFNYERIYQRPASVAQGAAVVEVLSALVGYFIAHPGAVPLPPDRDEDDAARAVRYVDGMTDRFCFEAAVELLGFPRQRLPVGIDVVPGTA